MLITFIGMINLKLFFSLSYKEEHIYTSSLNVQFDKRFIYEDDFILAKVRVVNFFEKFSQLIT